MRWLADAGIDFTPRLAASQLRGVVRLGIVLRWVAIAFAGVAGLLGPHVPRYLTFEILAALVYNTVVMAAHRIAGDESLRTIALITTAIDQVFCFVFIGLYAVAPASQQVAAYVPGMIEAAIYFGTAGIILSTGLFVLGIIFAQTTGILLTTAGFDGSQAFGSAMIVVLIGACLAGVMQVLRAADDEPADAPAVRAVTNRSDRPALSERDRHVLRLVAEGCSNSMIASRLGVSERRVKASVERLLWQLNARNRAEAVAAASRLELLR